ncbi:helix-turn-helix transcriptional regulator [Streptomyces dioscori]|uniref:Helix-turn-helix transcriptional regulator n=2 Tax=Streptomyces TaxID=1883 RepID=A0A2P8Q5L9_9ACTN|nr:AAA family ATPase [Streptomyces dioscori]PSM41525.1 helix-turn-helix transcriptional regulator [Streptomyces dioscori]
MYVPLLERRQTLELVAAEAARARAGTGRLVLLRGATGTGRSALLEAAAEQAESAGMRVLRARCSPDDTALPFSAVRQLLGPHAEFAEVREVPDERARGAWLWRLLRSFTAGPPLLVTVDDVHLADDASRRWLVDAARRVDRLPVLLVVTERSQYDMDAPSAGLAHTLSPALVRTLTLAPLGADSTAQLVRSDFGTVPQAWVEDCVRASAGSPLLLRALLDDLRGTLPATVPRASAALYPGAYQAAVSWWLDSAGPATTEVARTLATLDDTLPGPRVRTSFDAPNGATPVDRRGPAWPEAGSSAVAAASADTGARGAEAASAGSGPDGDAGCPDAGDPTHGEPAEHGRARPSKTPRPAGEGPRADGFSGEGPRADGFSGEGPRADGFSGVGSADGGVAGDATAVGGAIADAATPGGTAADAPLPGGPGGPGGPAADTPAADTPALTDLPPDDTAARELAELLGGVTDADPARVTGWLTAMTRLGFLRAGADGRPHYAHPLLRDAVLSGWPVARRRAAHRRAAEVMLRRGERAEIVAGQLLRADAVGEPWVTGVLLDASAIAVHDGRTADALPYLRRALDEPLPDDHRQRLLTELGSLEYATVRSSAGIPRLAEAVRLPGVPQDRVRAAVALGTALAGRGEARAAVDVLRSLDSQLTGHPDLARTVQIASALLSDQDHEIRQEVYRWLRESAGRSPHLVGPAGQALLVRYEATAGLLSADAAMERVRALLAEPVEPLAEPFLLGTAAAVAQWADELEEAERLVGRGLARQRPSLLHPMHRALLNVHADIAAARGDYARLLTGPEARPSPGARLGPGNGQAHAVIALVETGRAVEARRLAGGFDLREAKDSWEVNRFLYARGVLRAAGGDLAGALDDFLECGRRQSARDVLSPVVTPWRTASAECRLALGRPREALELAEEELRLAQVWNTPRPVGRALRVLGMATGGRRGLELADQAVRVLRDAPADVPLDTELIPALVAQGRQLTAAGERARARDCLREAAERAERLGAVRLRADAEQALREGGARRTTTALTGSGALTGSERRIAELAADGRTNTEIAELLHLARRTVETHLTSTYRKLGIRRRGELTTALGGRRGG